MWMRKKPFASRCVEKVCIRLRARFRNLRSTGFFEVMWAVEDKALVSRCVEKVCICLRARFGDLVSTRFLGSAGCGE